MYQPSSGYVMSQEEISAFYQQYAPQVLNYLRIHLKSREDAEDVLVEIFLACLENAAFATMGASQQRLWLWRVAHNKLVDFYRRKIARQGIVNFDDLSKEIYYDDELSPEWLAERGEEYVLLSDLVRELPPAQLQVLQLRLVHDLPYKKIADQMGKNETAVRSLFYRALTLLRSAYRRQQGGHHDR